MNIVSYLLVILGMAVSFGYIFEPFVGFLIFISGASGLVVGIDSEKDKIKNQENIE